VRHTTRNLTGRKSTACTFGPTGRELNKLTLVYSHTLAELRTIFKDGVYCDTFEIVKREPRKYVGVAVFMPALRCCLCGVACLALSFVGCCQLYAAVCAVLPALRCRLCVAANLSPTWQRLPRSECYVLPASSRQVCALVLEVSGCVML
jgi:hypothetical protein